MSRLRSIWAILEVVSATHACQSPAKRLERGEPVIAKVLDAAIQEIALVGYEGLTLERVAARAGVNRTTIYRRWPTKVELARATMDRLSNTITFDWDTGSMRGDLAELIARAAQTIFAPGSLGLLRMILGVADVPELKDLALCLQNEKRSKIMEMVDRWGRRGEIRPDLDREIFLDSVMGVLFRRIVFLHEDFTAELADRIVDHFCQTAAPVAPRRLAAVKSPTKTRRR